SWLRRRFQLHMPAISGTPNADTLPTAHTRDQASAAPTGPHAFALDHGAANGSGGSQLARLTTLSTLKAASRSASRWHCLSAEILAATDGPSVASLSEWRVPAPGRGTARIGHRCGRRGSA